MWLPNKYPLMSIHLDAKRFKIRLLQKLLEETNLSVGLEETIVSA